MNIQAVNDYVFVKPDEEKPQTKGGILLPESVKKNIVTGVVLSIGEHHKSIKQNSKVMFHRPYSEPQEIDDDQFYLIKTEDIIGVINE